MNWILWWDWPYVLFDINYLLMLGTDWLFGINCLIKLGTDCNYFLGNINYCFIWNEFSDNIGNVWNQLYNKIKHWLVWIIWQKVLLGINSLITLLITVWNEFSDKIKYHYSKSSYNVKSLAYHFCLDKDFGRFSYLHFCSFQL